MLIWIAFIFVLQDMPIDLEIDEKLESHLEKFPGGFYILGWAKKPSKDANLNKKILYHICGIYPVNKDVAPITFESVEIDIPEVIAHATTNVGVRQTGFM